MFIFQICLITEISTGKICLAARIFHRNNLRWTFLFFLYPSFSPRSWFNLPRIILNAIHFTARWFRDADFRTRVNSSAYTPFSCTALRFPFVAFFSALILPNTLAREFSRVSEHFFESETEREGNESDRTLTHSSTFFQQTLFHPVYASRFPGDIKGSPIAHRIFVIHGR